MSDVKESYIESELYRIFKNAIERRKEYGGIIFYDVKDRMPVGDGEADIVVFGKESQKEIKLVIETKKKTQRFSRKLDPYSVSVIGQALGYAGVLAAQFIATTNGDIFVLFDSFKRESILQSQIGDSYKVEFSEDFAAKVLSDLSRYVNGRLELLDLGQIFVERLRYFHFLLSEPTYSSLKTLVKVDHGFSARYSDWIQKQGFKNNDSTMKNIAEQEAYLVMNRVLFHKTLEAYQKGLDILALKGVKEDNFEPEEFIHRMKECFSYVVKYIDYEAVFKSAEILDDIPISDEVAEYLNEFTEDIEQYNLSEFNRDVIGDLYQSLIPPIERKRLGQYYTPKEICEFLVNFSLNNAGDKVLDPSCGSGGFLVSAYNRLKYLNSDSTPESQIHNKILGQIFGTDINQFATHLSVVNLTLRNLKAKTDKVNVFPVDFFRVPALQSSLTDEHERESLKERTKEFVIFGQGFDAVIANPPYTRQDDIGNKEYVEQLRRTSLTFYESRRKGKKVKTIEKTIKMSSEAGIYAYFFTHSAHFLKEDGIMSFIVSNSWLDVQFGRDLQKFFLDNFKIIGILDFDRRVFEDAAVNTVIVLFQKASSQIREEERDRNVTKFIRIKKPMAADKLISIIRSSDTSIENDIFRLELVEQRHLKDSNKWSLYLKAPPIYYRLKHNRKMCNLEDVADITAGYVTLANDFFIISKEEATDLGIEREFLFPSLTKAKNLHFLDVRIDDADSLMLFVDKQKSKLKSKKVLKYIQSSESRNIEITRGASAGHIVRGFQNTPALVNKKDDWYVLKNIGTKPIIVPVLIWERWYASFNRDGVYVNDTFYWISPKIEKDLKPLFCFLNSSIAEFLVELMGKTVYGEGVIQMRKHILKELPTIKTDQIEGQDREKLFALFDEIIENSRSQNQVGVDSCRRRIDDVFYGILGFEMEERSQIVLSLRQMRENRRNKVSTEIIVK